MRFDFSVNKFEKVCEYYKPIIFPGDILETKSYLFGLFKFDVVANEIYYIDKSNKRHSFRQLAKNIEYARQSTEFEFDSLVEIGPKYEIYWRAMVSYYDESNNHHVKTFDTQEELNNFITNNFSK